MHEEVSGFVVYYLPTGQVGAPFRAVYDTGGVCCYVTKDGKEIAVPASDPAVRRWLLDVMGAVTGAPAPNQPFELVAP
jgi:hypothetical protein